VLRRCCCAVVYALGVFRIWRAGSRIVNISVETVVRYWQSGIDRDVRRLWRTVGHKELGDFGRKEFGVRM
jgi:hypothetical protein